MGFIQEKIQRSTAHLFVKFGYERINLKLIAQASGVTLANITTLFYNKQDLLRFSFLEAIGQMVKKLVQAGSVEYNSLRAATSLLWKNLQEYEVCNKEEYIFVHKSLKALPYYQHKDFSKDLFKEVAPLTSFLAKMDSGVTPFKAVYILNYLINVLAKINPLETHPLQEAHQRSYFDEVIWPEFNKVIRLPFQ